MLAGIYYGAQYGGSTTSILVNIPGEASTVVTCLDGYQDGQARQGRSGPGNGRLRVFHRRYDRPRRAHVPGSSRSHPLALRFGPPEYFSLMCLGLTILIYLASGSVVRAIMMAAFGVILGCIGQDPDTGLSRFVFGVPDLLDGIGLAPLVMGLLVFQRSS